jgi:hypothetical protein
MRRFIATLGVVTALAAGTGTGLLIAGAEEQAQQQSAPAVDDPAVPAEPQDRGADEYLVLVVGGSFPSQETAAEAGAGMAFGELQGYYVARRDQFEGIDEYLGSVRGEWVLVSAFRTQEGAEDFAELAKAAGAPALITGRVLNRGDRYVGLGQEAAPDGAGPQRGPIAGVTLR